MKTDALMDTLLNDWDGVDFSISTYLHRTNKSTYIYDIIKRRTYIVRRGDVYRLQRSLDHFNI